MNVLLAMADRFRHVLVPFLIGAGGTLAVMLAWLTAQRLIRDRLAARLRRLQAQYQPLVDRVVGGETDVAIARLARATQSRRRVAGAILLRQVRALTGQPIISAREFAGGIGLVPIWRRDLADRRWWRRADAVRALGAIQEASAYPDLVAALDDPNEEVRAAAAESLGRLGDVAAVTELLDRLPEQSRHQRVRIVEALRALGRQGGAAVLAYARAHPSLLPLVAELLALVCGTSALDDLIAWSADPRAEIRRAALAALGAIGLDDRSFYHALRALSDESPDVRATAARALGRSGRSDAAAYLAARLDDEWQVAAESARSLAQLEGGRAELERVATAAGQAADLARQMLWQIDRRLVRGRTRAARLTIGEART